jgi:DnaK suppressor protein
MKRVDRARGRPGLEPFRRMLSDKRAAVLANLGARFDGRAHMGRLAEEDEAQVSHEEFISLSLNHIDYQQLGLVEEALDRIRAGEFGVCLACGDPIPEKRLRALPWARYCVPCQERVASGAAGAMEPDGEVVEAVSES